MGEIMRTARFWTFAWAAAVSLAAGAVGAGAQTSFPMIISTFPSGVERGKTVIVTVNAGTVNGGGGANLYGAYKVMVEGKGVQAEIVPPEKGWPPKDPKTPNAVPGVASVSMKVTVAADAPLGIREFRVATQHQGVSSIGLLAIGDEPESMEVEPNNDPEHAQQITIPTVMNGRFQQGEDVDWYKFSATAGEELVFAVQCARLEDKIHDIAPHADPMLVLFDATGNELARNDDYYRADSLLHYKFEKAGEYRIQIRDVNYQGSPHWVYRLNVTARPYVTSVIPCAVQAGKSMDVRVLGWNLGGAQTARVDVPAGTPAGLWDTPLKLPNGTTNWVPLLVTDAPQAGFEGGASPAGNKTITAALTVAPPMAKGALALPGGVNSWLGAPGQIDRYRFHATKGQALGFEVTARRIDSELDSEIKIRDAKGGVLAENDDAIGKDSRIDWTAPADGDYTVDIRDLTGHGGPTYFYNLTAAPLRPDFHLKCDTDRAMLGPGNRTAWFVILDRKYGFAGDVKVHVDGLPAGVTASALTIPPQMSQGVILLSAAPDAKIDMARVEVVGVAALPGADGKLAEASRTATPLTEIYLPGGGRGLYEVDTQAASVTDPNDVQVVLPKSDITIAPGQTLKIDVEIKRRADYTKPVTLDLRVNHLGGIFTNPLPPGITVDDGATIPEGQTKGQITLKAAADAKPIANWPLAVMANVSVNFVMKVWYAAPLSLTVKK
jgi:hypothetical protein